MKLIFCLLFFIGCGDDKKTTVYEPDPPSGGGSGGNPGGGGSSVEAKYAQARPTLKGSCLTSGCHANGAIVDLTTAAKYLASNSKARISGGSMPPPQSGPGKAFTANKKAILLAVFD